MVDVVGPVKIKYIDKEDENIRELIFEFTEAFKALPLKEQGSVFKQYLNTLATQMLAFPEDSSERFGMSVTLQICDSLLEPIVQGQLPLSEPIVAEIPLEQRINHVTDLLN